MEKNFVSRLLEKDHIIEETEDELGRAQISVRADEVKFSHLLSSKDKEVSLLKGEIKKMGIRPSKVDFLVTSSTETKDTIYVPVYDTLVQVVMLDQPVPAKKFSHRDEFLVLDGLLLADSVGISYSLLEKHILATHYKRDGLFKPYYLRAEFKSMNPNTRNSALQVFKAKAPRPIFVIGPSIGGGMVYNGSFHFGAFFGLTLTIPIYYYVR